MDALDFLSRPIIYIIKFLSVVIVVEKFEILCAAGVAMRVFPPVVIRNNHHDVMKFFGRGGEDCGEMNGDKWCA
jgi:hypothetical protein